MSQPDAPLVLVVDDSRVVRRIAAQQLEADGLLVAECADGEEALATASAVVPDLILLDMTMPGMDGIETCRRLKAMPTTVHVPVIFFSATSDLDRVVAGLEAGATDYVAKPFQPAELVARVRAHVRMKRLQDELKRANERLQELERARQDFVAMLTHDMRTLVNGVVGAVGMLDEIGVATKDPLGGDLLGMIRANADELVRMITSLLDIARMDEGEMPLERVSMDMRQIARDAIEHAAPAALAAKVEIRSELLPGAVVEGDPVLLGRVVGNLLANAVKFSPADTAVRVVVEPGIDQSIRVAVIDAGPGIPAEEQSSLFGRFYQARRGDARQKGGSGLGLAFCKRAIELHGGRIWVESEPGRGSSFKFALAAHTPGDRPTAETVPAPPVTAPS